MPSKMSVTPFEKFIFEPVTEVCHVTENFDTPEEPPKYLIARISMIMQVKLPEDNKKRMLQVIGLCIFIIGFEFFC